MFFFVGLLPVRLFLVILPEAFAPKSCGEANFNFTPQKERIRSRNASQSLRCRRSRLSASKHVEDLKATNEDLELERAMLSLEWEHVS